MNQETPSVLDSRKRSVAWPPFAQQLAKVLARLEEDQYLVISVKRSSRYVQFAGQGSFGLRAETTSNAYLKKAEKLTRKPLAALLAAGWSAPTGKPKHATPENDPDGSPNYFADFPASADYQQAAQLAVTTFADILQVPHLGMLEYEAFDAEGRSILLPDLQLKLVPQIQPAPGLHGQATIADKLLGTLRETTGIADLDFDSDGDIGVRYGSTVVFARVIDEPPAVHLYAPLLREVDENPGIVDRLNQLNGGSQQLRYFYRESTVYGVADIPASPYVGGQVSQCFEHFCRVADDLDNLLQNEFGGSTMFPEWMPSVARH